MFETFKSHKSAIFWQVTEQSISAQLPDWLDILRPTVGIAKIPCRKHMILFVWCHKYFTIHTERNVRRSAIWHSSLPGIVYVLCTISWKSEKLSKDGKLRSASSNRVTFWQFLQSLLSKYCQCWFTAATLLTPTIGHKLSGQSGNFADNCSQMMALLISDL